MFTFEQVFAADPANPSNIAQNAAVTIFAPGDVTMTPLTITDPDGQPLANPLTVNANGFGSAFAHATLDRVAWAGGGFTGFFTSYEGMKQVAVDAQAAAEAAAATAGADAAAVATAAIGDATSDANAAAASAAAAAASAADAAATASAPADTAIAAAVNNGGSATRGALNATYAPTTGSPNYMPSGLITYAAAPSGGDDTGMLTAAIAACPLGAKLILRQGATYNADRIVVDRKIILDFNGATLKQNVTASVTSFFVLSAVGSEARNGIVDGNSDNQSFLNHGVVISSDDSKFIDMTVQNCKGYGIRFTANRVVIDRPTVLNTGSIAIFGDTAGKPSGLTGGRISKAYVDRSMISAASIADGGIKVHGDSNTNRFNNFQINDPVVYMPTSPTDGQAIPVELMWSNGSVISNALTFGGALGISLAECFDCLVSGTATSASQYGLELARTSGTTATVNVVGNGITGKGIDINAIGTTSAKNTLLGCHVAGVTVTGIALETGVVDTTINGGSVDMTVAGHAIEWIGTGSVAGSITGVRLKGNSTSNKAIYLNGVWGVSIVGNVITNFLQNSTMVSATSAVTVDNIMINGNTITGTANGAFATQLSGGAVLGVNVKVFNNSSTDYLNYGSDQRLLTGVVGTPEGAYSASPGSLALRTEGGDGRGLYIKHSGTGNTGWAIPGAKFRVTAKTANYTANSADFGTIVVFNGASLTATLPAASANFAGYITIKNQNATALTVNTAGGNIDGAATASVTQYGVLRLISDGTVWCTL